MTEADIPIGRKLDALKSVAMFRPITTVAIVVLSMVAAALEGIGMSFILPIVEQGRSGGAPPSGGLSGMFASAYDLLGIPFTLEYILVGVTTVMVVRFSSSFAVAWLKSILENTYIRETQTLAFENALDATIAYFDREGSDDILNAIITQAVNAGRAVRLVVQLLQEVLLVVAYLALALYLAPVLTVATAAVLGAVVMGFRRMMASGYGVGDRVAQANEHLQRAVQAGMQGIRDVKLFGMKAELFDRFDDAVDRHTSSRIRLQRNEAVIQNFYQLTTAVTIFALIYVALQFTSLSLGGLGVFLFAMFRLGPRLSSINSHIYSIEGELPHLVRTQRFIDRLRENRLASGDESAVPTPISETAFDEVSFAYPTGERVLDRVSFSVERGDFVAFVGPSGAGKSTVMAILSRMYDPDEGEVLADGVPIDEYDVAAWRERVSVVRQDPFIFNDTLEYNVTVGNRDASRAEVERVCEIAQVTEYLDELPEGYRTPLGDNGVRLSGGQRQRIAIARALLKDADLLVLDEATSDLDRALERKVHDGIEAMERDYAMIVIAHRLSTVTNADRIYTMKNGHIVEEGPHQELLTNDGTYASLYAVRGRAD